MPTKKQDNHHPQIKTLILTEWEARDEVYSDLQDSGEEMTYIISKAAILKKINGDSGPDEQKQIFTEIKFVLDNNPGVEKIIIGVKKSPTLGYENHDNKKLLIEQVAQNIGGEFGSKGIEVLKSVKDNIFDYKAVKKIKSRCMDRRCQDFEKDAISNTEAAPIAVLVGRFGAELAQKRISEITELAASCPNVEVVYLANHNGGCGGYGLLGLTEQEEIEDIEKIREKFSKMSELDGLKIVLELEDVCRK